MSDNEEADQVGIRAQQPDAQDRAHETTPAFVGRYDGSRKGQARFTVFPALGGNPLRAKARPRDVKSLVAGNCYPGTMDPADPSGRWFVPQSTEAVPLPPGASAVGETGARSAPADRPTLRRGAEAREQMGRGGRAAARGSASGAGRPSDAARRSGAPRSPAVVSGFDQALRKPEEGGFVNPYAFVSFPPVAPVRSEPLTHDRFLTCDSEGAAVLSGVIEVGARALSPLFTAGASLRATSATPSGEPQPSRLSFLRVDGRIAIAGSTLKGLVRSAAETLSGSCMRVFDAERRLSYRDNPDSATRSVMNAPYRVIEVDEVGGHIVLEALEAFRLPVRARAGGFSVDLTGKCDGEEVGFEVDGFEEVGSASSGKSGHGGMRIAKLSSSPGARRGWLKLSDVPEDDKGSSNGTDRGRKDSSRKNQFLVAPTGDRRRSTVPLSLKIDYDVAIDPSIRNDAKELTGPDGVLCCARHNEHLKKNGEVAKWGRRKGRHRLEPGDIVWASDKENKEKELTKIAATQIPRLAYVNTLGDAVPKGLLPCGDLRRLCPCCRVFGMVPPGADDEGPGRTTGVAGHVRISPAFAVGKVQLERRVLPPLDSPKPTFASFYLRPEGSRASKWRTAGESDRRVHANGRKYYWHSTQVREPESSPDRADLLRAVDTVPSGTSFRFEVRFDNCTEVELGMLLAAIDPGLLGAPFGATSAHKLGMGKPLGMGSVKFEVRSIRLVDRPARYRCLEGEAGEEVLSGSEARDRAATFAGAFAARMAKHWGCDAAKSEVWSDLAALLDPATTESRDVRYPPGGPPGKPAEGFKWFQANADQVLATPGQVKAGLGQSTKAHP